MKGLYFQSVGGASGDMILGALAGLGLDRAALQRDLAAWLPGPFSLAFDEAASHGLHGLRATVRCAEAQGEHAPSRPLRVIRSMLAAADLPPPVRARSLDVFKRLAAAEARVHGVPVEEVHFHEVGALDALVDIVGSCLALHRLGVEAVWIDELPVGCGTMRCAHGVYPVPVPAVVELLKGFPVTSTGEPFELVTPTGAALLMSWRTGERPPSGARMAQAAYGFGQRTLRDRPNVLRAVLYETDGEAGESDEVLVLETNLDDTTPELIGVTMEQARKAGALDASASPLQMKKQRPGVLLRVLCRPEDRARMLDVLFRGVPTFGVRESRMRRTTLSRRMETVQTPFGAVRIKIGLWQGEVVARSPEMDDCVARAQEHGVSARAVYEAASHAAAVG